MSTHVNMDLVKDAPLEVHFVDTTKTVAIGLPTAKCRETFPGLLAGDHLCFHEEDTQKEIISNHQKNLSKLLKELGIAHPGEQTTFILLVCGDLQAALGGDNALEVLRVPGTLAEGKYVKIREGVKDRFYIDIYISDKPYYVANRDFII